MTVVVGSSTTWGKVLQFICFLWRALELVTQLLSFLFLGRVPWALFLWS